MKKARSGKIDPLCTPRQSDNNKTTNVKVKLHPSPENGQKKQDRKINVMLLILDLKREKCGIHALQIYPYF